VWDRSPSATGPLAVLGALAISVKARQYWTNHLTMMLLQTQVSEDAQPGGEPTTTE
jgi:hypothetical protein